MDKHRPPHIYKDAVIYFITCSTANKLRLFDKEQKKEMLLEVIFKACDRFTKQLLAWTVLDNHYHVLVESDKGEKLAQFVNNINANSSRILNKFENCIGRKIWYQYFDRCIRDEKDYWTRFNYMHHNCIKHGYAKSMEDYKYSSYSRWVKDKGIEWMNDVFDTYPIIDFSVEGEVD